MYKKIGPLFAAALTFAFTLPAQAQQYKTDTPPAIMVPDHIETRLGTLRFTDGFPDDATVQTVYDNLDFQRGVQAFLTAMPAASLSAMREGLKRHRREQQHGRAL